MIRKIGVAAAAVLIVSACSGPSDADWGSGGGAGGGSGGSTGGGSGGGSGGASGGGTGGASGSSLSGPEAFPVVTAGMVLGTLLDGGLDFSCVQVGLTDQVVSSICAVTSLPLPARFVSIPVGIGDDGGVVTARTYTIDTGSPPSPTEGVNVVRATYGVGTVDTIGTSVSGTVTFTQLDAQRSKGSFSVQLALEDGGVSTLTGSWDAPVCTQ